MYYHTRMAEEDKRTYHINNLTPGFSSQPFIIDQTGNLGPQATGFITVVINKISGIEGESEAADVGKKLSTNSIESLHEVTAHNVRFQTVYLYLMRWSVSHIGDQEMRKIEH